MARVEARQRAGEPREPRFGQRVAVEAQPARQLVPAEALDLRARPVLGIEARRVDRLPERIARHPALERDGELGDESVEAAASHAMVLMGEWRGSGPRDARPPPRALRWLAALALASLACAGPSGRSLVPDEQLARLAQRVEVARNLHFRAPVVAEHVTQAAVPALLEAELDRSTPPEQLAREQALAEALALLPRGADLRATLLSWQAQAVAGFYSPATRRLFVVQGAGAAGGIAEDGVLIHELAHALQDQRSQLLAARIGVQANDDLQFALGAFLEGDALWTELRDEALASGFPQPSGAEFRARFEAEAPDGAGVPLLLRESFLRQYPLGYAVAAELVARGGLAALSAALEDPPLSSEELLHRERYLLPSARRPLEWFPESVEGFAPEPGCKPVTSTSYGELGIRVWLSEAGLPDAEAALGADGWDGDRAWLLRCAGGPVVAWLIQLDSESEARELEERARSTGWTQRAGLAAPVGIERVGRRLLLFAGLAPAGRGYLLERLEAQRYPGLAALLAAHREILERAAQQRDGPR
jgi:hypothetical protein